MSHSNATFLKDRRVTGDQTRGWSMHIDVLLDAFGAGWTDVREAAKAAADAGFAGIWTFDHVDGGVYGAPHVLECWTLLSALAVSVPDVMIGPLVLNVANRPAGVLAPMAATLQHVSPGRLLLGVGAGAHPGTRYAREQQTIGQPVYADVQRRAQLERWIDDVRRLWRLPGFLRPDPEPPLIVGAFGPKMAELAGRVADGINTRASHPHLPELLDVAREAHRRVGLHHDRFLVTVFADFDEDWLSPESPAHARLAELEVDRLVLFVTLPHDPARLAAAGRLLPR